jgi:membrane-bound lytic murein transglycosylase B
MNKIFMALIGALFIFSAHAENKQTFTEWLADFKREARQQDISQKTIHETFKHAKFLPRVIEMDRAQPEFISPFFTYLYARATPNRVEQGRALMQEHDELLSQVEAQYGVPKSVIMAFWGMETHYGSNQGDFGLPSALATLAYEGRRATFFRNQLMNALQVVDEGYMSASSLRGSWAGAMGHLQFMPSVLFKYGIDADGDGHVNVKKSLPDAFMTAGNYLYSIGWHRGEPIAIEVFLPQDFDYAQASLLNRKSSVDWLKMGIWSADGAPIPNLENAAILLPQGWQGPSFMVANNFDMVMDWNRSVNYALSVSYLADQLVADKPVLGGLQADPDGLSYEQMLTLQTKLNALGFDCGQPDGFPGLKTQAAIRQYQAAQHLPQDGYAGPSLYQQLLQ